MKYKMLGSLKISEIIYGSWRIEENENFELRSFLLQLAELGINSIDTAQVYGSEFHKVESLLGEILSEQFVRSKFNIITKSGIGSSRNTGYYDCTYDYIVSSVLKSIKSLNCKKIDLFLIHRPDCFSDFEEIKDAFLYLKNNNYVLEFGVSNFSTIEFESLDFYLKNYGINLVTNQIEHNVYSTENISHFNYLKSRSISPMIWSPFAGGNVFKINNEVLTKISNAHNCTIFDICISYIRQSNTNPVIIFGSHNIENYIRFCTSECLLSKEQMYEILKISTKKEVK